MRRISIWKQIATQVILFLVGLFVILHLWGIARLAFDDSHNGRPTEFRILPK